MRTCNPFTHVHHVYISCSYKRILVMISHSQDFLNGVCTNIIHMHKQKLVYYGVRPVNLTFHWDIICPDTQSSLKYHTVSLTNGLADINKVLYIRRLLLPTFVRLSSAKTVNAECQLVDCHSICDVCLYKLSFNICRTTCRSLNINWSTVPVQYRPGAYFIIFLLN